MKPMFVKRASFTPELLERFQNDRKPCAFPSTTNKS